MAQIREITISSIGEPAHITLEKNTKGYNFTISLYGDNCEAVIDEIFAAQARLEKQLYGINNIPGGGKQ